MRRSRSASRATRSRLRRNWRRGAAAGAIGRAVLAELIDEAAAFEDAGHLPRGPTAPIELSTVE
jgi:hypothetical protein